jgi:hypothetical protein
MNLKPMYRQWAKAHPNFMTPHIIRVAQGDDNMIVELSEGEGFDHEPLYGVSVLKYKGNGEFTTMTRGNDTDPDSKCFQDRKEADKHFAKVLARF